MARSIKSYTPKVDAVDDVMAAHINLLQTDMEKVWNTFAFVEATELTLDAAGAVIVTQNYHTIDTLADAASGNLVTITISGNICEGSLLFIRPDHDARTIVVKHGTGNILCTGQADITLDDVEDTCVLIYDETLACWLAIGGGGGGSTVNSICNGRLTLESSVPVSMTDQAAKAILYFTPYGGNQAATYNGATWDILTFAELSLVIAAYTDAKNYDIWLYNNAGTLALESTIWTNDTTRATALAMQDGIYCKTGTLTRRYLGTIRCSAEGQTSDTIAFRGVWNYNNRVQKSLVAIEATSHTYNGAERKWNNSDANNLLKCVLGVNEQRVNASAVVTQKAGAAASISYVTMYIGGVSNLQVFIRESGGQYQTGGVNVPITVTLGYMYFQLYEFGNHASCTFSNMNIAVTYMG